MGRDIRILVVDDGPGLTQDLLLSLGLRSQVRVLGPVPDVSGASEALADGLVHLVLVDLDREDGRGAEIVREVRDADERAKVLVVTAGSGAEPAAAALAAGACGVISRQADLETLRSAFDRALGGELVLPSVHLPAIVDRLNAAARPLSDAERLDALTPREIEVLRALAAGMSTGEIAAQFGISVTTVQSHVKNVLAKLAVHSKVEAVRIAWRAGATPARSA